MERGPGRGEPIVWVRGLTKLHGDVHALEGITFAVPWPGLYVFVGPRRSGKTTLLRILGGQLSPSGGSGAVGGRDLFLNATWIWSRVGFASANHPIYDTMSPLEYLAFWGFFRNIRGDQRIRKVLGQLSLMHVAERRISTLTLRQRRTICLAQALLHEPNVLLLDDLFADLSAQDRRMLAVLVRREARQRCVLATLEEAHLANTGFRLFGQLSNGTFIPHKLRTRHR